MIIYIIGKTNRCRYYSDTLNYFKKKYNLVNTIYYKNISKISDINKKFNIKKIKLIIIGFSVTNCSNNSPKYIKNDTKIPVVIILNKEYAALNKKLEWIKKREEKRKW